MKSLIASTLLGLCAYQMALGQGQEMPRRTCRECEITKTYQPLTKTTVVLLSPMSIAKVDGGEMYVSLATDYRGNDTKIKKTISFFITFIAKQVIEAKDPVLQAQSDESPLSFGRLARDDPDTEGNLRISSYTGLVKWNDVLTLGQGKQVEITFDGIKVRLTAEHKAAILDFLKYGEGDP